MYAIQMINLCNGSKPIIDRGNYSFEFNLRSTQTGVCDMFALNSKGECILRCG